MLPTLTIGPLSIWTHDAFSVAALLIGLAIYYRELRRRGWMDDRIVLVSLGVVLGGILGARTITVWENGAELQAAYEVGELAGSLSWVVLHGNKSLLGGLAGGFLGGVLTKRLLGYTRSTGDAYVMAIAVATIVGRIGCFLTELPLGTPTDLPWGMTVSREAAAAFPRCPGCDGPMHPTMLYEIGFNALAIIVVVRWGRLVPVPGDLLKLYLLGAFAFRFGVEFLRTSPAQALGLTAPQWVLVPLMVWLALHFVGRARTGAWRVPAAPPAEAAT